MGLIVTFLLGIGNFAAQKAIFASDHIILSHLPKSLTRNQGRGALLLEFVILLTAMLFAGHGYEAGVWGYAVYSALNFVSAWFVLSGRM